jgi:GT2 family glycosyltransferase
MISVIIPTYKSPDVLDLCLRSVIEGQANQNQIIVVVDGFYDINKEEWKRRLDILEEVIRGKISEDIPEKEVEDIKLFYDV